MRLLRILKSEISHATPLQGSPSKPGGSTKKRPSPIRAQVTCSLSRSKVLTFSKMPGGVSQLLSKTFLGT